MTDIDVPDLDELRMRREIIEVAAANRALAALIRQRGTCAPMALEVLAAKLEGVAESLYKLRQEKPE